MPITDDKNPGRRQVQRFNVDGALNDSQVDSISKPTTFAVLKNCLIDRRIGGVVKRPGSLHDYSKASCIPLGLTEYAFGTTGQIPIDRTLIALLSDDTLVQKNDGVWSALDQSTRCDFSTTRAASFSQVADFLAITAGKPARWLGGAGDVEMIGIDPLPAAPIVVSYNTGTGITLVTGTSYVVTLYNATTGVESDWSAISTAVPAITNKQVVLHIPVLDEADFNYDSFRIYRYLDGGAIPYLVDEVTKASLSTGGSPPMGQEYYVYNDTTADVNLLSPIFEQGSHLVPPTESYISAAYASSIWMVNADNPYQLVFSEPYQGALADLEYYPNFFMFNDPITGLLEIPNKLLVFHPRGVSAISGFSKDDFAVQPFLAGIGTFMHHSIASNGDRVVWLAERGYYSVPSQGGDPEYISREINEALGPILNTQFQTTLFASTCWNPTLGQFLFSIGGVNLASPDWVDPSNGNAVTWEDPADSSVEVWEAAGSDDALIPTRSKIWGWSPELSSTQAQIWCEYTFPWVEDENDTSSYPVVMYHPHPSAALPLLQQPATLLASTSNDVAYVSTILDLDQERDNGARIRSELVTGRLVPGSNQGNYKLFHSLGFVTLESDPTIDGDATISYLLEYDDPQLYDYSASLVDFNDDTDLKKFPQMLGRHIHLVIVDTSDIALKPLLSEYFIHFRERYRREGR